MERTLGIDLGTNSIGWAVVLNYDDHTELQDAGSLIFPEGVAREKGNERPAVETRTNARATRRHYFRRRLHKIELLKALIANDMCPHLSEDDLALWRSRKIYPTDPAFLEWQRTSGNDNPYFVRNEALNTILDLSNRHDRHLLGRALYHLAQRRGFLSNRKEQTKEADGVVKKGISELSALMEESGCRYLGEYFYSLYTTGGKIRTRHTDRLKHTEKEFYAICEQQSLPDELVKQLHRAIFFQRPLKSQKGLVGKCTFETSRSRCPVSHPAFEEYRMLSFLNNIRVLTAGSSVWRPLSAQERSEAIPLFYRKSKDSFDFEDIAKKIAGKGGYSFRDDRRETPYKFNYRMSTSVSGCPVTAGLRGIFGDDWVNSLCEVYTLAAGKTPQQIVNDVWHTLYSFDSEEKLRQWAVDRLQLTPEQAESFTKIKVPQGYASLSLKAIRKILPYLREGIRYDEAVFVANLDAVLPVAIRDDEERKAEVTEEIIETLQSFDENPLRKTLTKQQAVRSILEDLPGIDYSRLDRLYHPSKLNVYPDAELNAAGELLLGSPRTSSIRNPMAMRALFKLRHLINRLLREGKIDRTTRINIEFARELNDANMRKAIERYQRENEQNRKKYAAEIRTLYKEATGQDIEPSETDILKYQLWEEQQHRCLYTGEQISITSFIGPDPAYDIEHTIPRSLGGDDSQANKTLCNARFNRMEKRAKLPSQLPGHDVIMERIESLGWNRRIDDLANEIARIKTSGASTKEIKDGMIQKRHYLKMKLDYWRGKLQRFTMEEVPEGFTNRQGVDIGIIGRYAREYLRSLFHSEERQIFTVKGLTTAEFRKMWGLQNEYAKKERINHCHHTIDAITIACIGRREYQQWAEYLRRADDWCFSGGKKPVFEKPWPTFTEDVIRIADHVLVVHDSPDNTLKQSRKALRKKGHRLYGSDGKPLFCQGDTARAMLHKQTYYGAIDCGGEVRYVVRVPVDSLAEKDIDKIVDPAVKARVKEALAERGFKHLFESPIWMNEAKGIAIKKVRVFSPSVTKPLHIKRHRDVSKHDYKQQYHVANDSNYCLAIYEGSTGKGKPKRSFMLVNNLEAVSRCKRGEEIVPLSDAADLPLKWLLKVGTMVLFYEKSPKELADCSREELARRLYKVTGLSLNSPEYARIDLRFHQEARPSTDSQAKNKNGRWQQGEDIRPGIIALHTQFNALVEGQDFSISETGEITFTHPL